MSIFTEKCMPPSYHKNRIVQTNTENIFVYIKTLKKEIYIYIQYFGGLKAISIFLWPHINSGRRMAGEPPVRQPIEVEPEPPSETETEIDPEHGVWTAVYILMMSCDEFHLEGISMLLSPWYLAKCWDKTMAGLPQEPLSVEELHQVHMGSLEISLMWCFKWEILTILGI